MRVTKHHSIDGVEVELQYSRSLGTVRSCDWTCSNNGSKLPKGCFFGEEKRKMAATDSITMSFDSADDECVMADER